MKKFSEIITEAHSYGMEPPINDYIKGLNAANERHAVIAKELKKKYKHLKGSFGKEETIHGVKIQHGTGDYEGYKLRPRSPAIPRSVSLSHGNGDTLSKITLTNRGHRVNHMIPNSSSFSEVSTFHKNEKEALHYAIAHHMDRKK